MNDGNTSFHTGSLGGSEDDPCRSWVLGLCLGLFKWHTLEEAL